MSDNTLARKISLPLLTFYGLGTILGAGIYVLIGEVTLRAGPYSSISFIVAAVIAAITAYSFARLSSLIPKSAGEAAYALAAFNIPSISAFVGIAVVIVGTVSAATMVRGFSGYFSAVIQIPDLIIILSIIIFITIFSIWGISQSLLVASLITIIEVIGLLFVIYAVIDLNEFKNYKLPEATSVLNNGSVIFYAAFISFYAYIGFEDIVNIAEETIDPTKVVPLAIILSLVLSTLIYVTLSIACTLFVPADVFSSSNAPLVSIIEYKGYDPTVMALISMIAIINGALVQLIMASRVLYGMAKQNVFVSVFKKVNEKTRTPIIATITIAIFITFLATSFNLVTLAELTSTVTLVVFITVQASLLFLSKNKYKKTKFDIILPITGIGLNLILIYFGYFTTV
ncbi:MAG: amino acid permease [Gammaproteobacteria bacterium]|nr:amino acid permease [Gammaproteobacteria bacterium]